MGARTQRDAAVVCAMWCAVAAWSGALSVTAAGQPQAPATRGGAAAPARAAGQAADMLLRGPTVPPNSSNALAGTFVWERDGFVEPVACASAGDGRFVVADASGAVRAMSAADGTPLWSVDRGAGGQLVRPSSVASYGDGAVLVSDPARGIVAMLSSVDGSDLGAWPPEGELRRAWERAAIVPGALASAPGPSDVPRVVVADANASGRVLVCDGDSVRVVGLPFVAAGAAIAADGSIMLSDRDGHRVMRLGPDIPADPSVPPVSSLWGGRGPYPGLLNSPRGMCAAGPWILVADEHNHRIVRCDAAGAGRLAYGQHAVRPRAGRGAVHYPVAVAHDAESGIALVCEPFERRVQAYRVNLGPEPADVRVVLPSLEGVQSHFGSGADADGQRLVMQDPESSSVVVFDLSLEAPAHVSTMGMAGTKPHEFVRISSMAMSGGGALVCVADDGARRIALWSLAPRESELRFNPFAGRLVGTCTYESLGIGASEGLADAVAVDGGFLLLASGGAQGTESPRAVHVSHLLESREQRPLHPPAAGRWMPRAIACDPRDGRLAWIARRADAPAGAAMRWVLAGDRVLELDAQDPVDLCITRDGIALVCDRLGDRVIEVAVQPQQSRQPGETPVPAGTRMWGGRGAADGALWLPVGILAHGDTVYVVDGGNHRGQAFGADGTWRSTFGLGRSYTRPRSEAEVLGLPGARGGTAVAAPAAGGVPSPVQGSPQRQPSVNGSATRDTAERAIPSDIASRLWWSRAEGGDAVRAPVRSNGGAFWIRARLSSDAPMNDASTPPLRRPFAIVVEAFEDVECTRPYIADGALIDSWMPHHRHGMNVAPRITAEAPGRWRAEGMLMHMSGLWEIDVDLVRDGRSERAQWMVELP